LNAIAPARTFQQAPEPVASDLGILQRLVELAMQLAELAARQAHEEAAPTPTPTDQAANDPPRHRRTDPHIVFLRLRRAIQETIAFRNRLADGILGKPSRERAPHQQRERAPRPQREPAPPLQTEPAPPPTPQPATLTPAAPQDPRRPHILRYFRDSIDITEKKRKTPITQAHIEDRVTAELASDPQQKIPGPALLLRICKSLDIPFYANRLPPDLFRPPKN